LVAWGNAFYSLGQFSDALQKYEEAIQVNSAFCPAYIARSLAYDSSLHQALFRSDTAHAEADLRFAIECDPNNEFAYTSLCVVLVKKWANWPAENQQSLNDAKGNCERALRINPKLVIAATNIGYILYRQGQHDEALRYLDDLSRQFPTDSNLFVNYGYLLYLEYLAGNHTALQLAIDQTSRSWQLSQNDRIRTLIRYGASNNLGYFHYEEGDFSQALTFWKAAEPLRNGDPDCLAGLALGYFKLGDPQMAVMALTRAIEIDRHYRDPQYLRQQLSWSPLAASDLASVIHLLP
jgi:tetratricopeptide (TPR) repeat protein